MSAWRAQPRFEVLFLRFRDEIILRLHKEFAKGIIDVFWPFERFRNFHPSQKTSRHFQNLPVSPRPHGGLDGQKFHAASPNQQIDHEVVNLADPRERETGDKISQKFFARKNSRDAMNCRHRRLTIVKFGLRNPSTQSDALQTTQRLATHD